MTHPTLGTPVDDWATTGTTPYVLPVPSTANGRLLLAHVIASTDADDIPTPSGWARECSAANNGRRSWFFSQVAGSSPPTTITFDRTAGARLMEGVCFDATDWYGSLPGGILVVTPITGFPAPDFASQTMPWGAADTKVLLLLAGGQSAHTAPTNYTQFYAYNADGFWGIYIQGWHRNITTASEDPPAMGADVTVIGFMVAIRPVAPADTTPPDVTSTGSGSTNGPFAANVAENSTAAFITLTANESVTWGSLGGADASRFVKLNETATTVQLGLNPALNFEALPHANPFVVTVPAADAASNLRTATVNASVTNVTELPGAPTIGTATAGVASASVAFTPPSAGSAPTVTGFTATSIPGGITGAGASSPITVSGLTPGTAYTFTVTATNSDGTGSASSASNSVAPTGGSSLLQKLMRYLRG